MKTQTCKIPSLTALAGCSLALVLGCDPDAWQRPDAADSVDDRKLMDTLDRENARIDMAAQEALASADASTAREATAHERPGTLQDSARAVDRAGEELSEDALRSRDEFVAQAREQLRRMQAEVQGIETRTDRRVEEIDASIEQDRRRAEEQLQRLVDETQDGYQQARDTIADQLRQLEARLQALRQRIEEEA